jgi:hypothetical protein
MDVSEDKQLEDERSRLKAQLEASYGKVDELSQAVQGLEHEVETEEAANATPIPAEPLAGGRAGLRLPFFRVVGIAALVVGVLVTGTFFVVRRGDPGGQLAKAKTLASELNVASPGVVVDTGSCPGVLMPDATSCNRHVEISLASQSEYETVLAQIKGKAGRRLVRWRHRIV